MKEKSLIIITDIHGLYYSYIVVFHEHYDEYFPYNKMIFNREHHLTLKGYKVTINDNLLGIMKVNPRMAFEIIKAKYETGVEAG